MITGRPPAPVPQEPAGTTARASPESLPHVDLEKTSDGGTSTVQTLTPPHTNGISLSQDSEATGFVPHSG